METITEATLILKNDQAFYTFFLKPYLMALENKKDCYDRDKAVNGLQERIRIFHKSCNDMDICHYRYKYIPTYIKLSKKERIEVAKKLIKL